MDRWLKSYRRYTGCIKKRSFPSKKTANKVVATAKNNEVYLRAYNCHQCNFWHLASKGKSNAK